MGHLHRRLIAFDLDGTLIDSSRDLANSVNELLSELDAPALPVDQVMTMIGQGAKMLIRRALAAAGRPENPVAISRFLEIYDRRLLDHTQPYAGITDVVSAARKHARVAILTNKPTSPTEKILAGLNIRQLFDDVIGSDGNFPRKPDPAALLALMQRAGAVPERTLMVGDSKIDYDTATNAGARCCLVAYGFTECARHPAAFPHARIAEDALSLADVIARFVAND